MMSAPSASWLATALSGVKRCRLPSMCERKVTASSSIRRSGASENTLYNTRLGAGPAIYVADRRTLSDPRLVRHLVETAEALGIPYQIRQPGGGGTDAGAIHKQLAGIPSVSVSVPARYPHTAAGICRLEDWKNTLALVHAALTNLTPEVLQPLE